MGVGATKKGGVEHSGYLDVIDVAALAGQQPGVFEPLDGLSDVRQFVLPSGFAGAQQALTSPIVVQVYDCLPGGLR